MITITMVDGKKVFFVEETGNFCWERPADRHTGEVGRGRKGGSMKRSWPEKERQRGRGNKG